MECYIVAATHFIRAYDTVTAFYYRGVANVTFELCDIAQIDALLRVYRPDFVLAKNSIQFFTEVGF